MRPRLAPPPGPTAVPGERGWAGAASLPAQAGGHGAGRTRISSAPSPQARGTPVFPEQPSAGDNPYDIETPSYDIANPVYEIETCHSG